MSVVTPRLTTLSYALLGLIGMEPRSGYALAQVFATTPIGDYSSSPGSLYPAIKVLEKQGLVEQRPAGKKKVFGLTATGATTLDAWLAEPVTGEGTSKHLSAHLMRFAFLQMHPDRRLTLTFLTDLASGLSAEAATLEAFLASDLALAMPEQSRWAVRHGLMTCLASRDWALGALAALEPTYAFPKLQETES